MSEDQATPPTGARRQLKSRDARWARATASYLATTGVTPNMISVISVLFSVVALACFLLAPDQTQTWAIVACWVGAIVGIQMRLICNLLDGMVAVEGGKASPVGAIYNEFPDRIADVLILVGAGYTGLVEPGVLKLFDILPLGWSCAVIAVWTAYIRVLGGTLTGTQDFMGPMAKQHRMAVLTVASLIALIQRLLGYDTSIIKWALVLILLGGLYTCYRRLADIAHRLRILKASA